MRVSNTDRIGVYASGHLISKELGWVFREQPIVDVGIDALLEEVISENPTGKFLAAQIKTGLGNFHVNEKHLTLYISKVHYHYWLNLDLPIILIAHLPDTDETLWELINKKNLFPTNKKWKINIPLNKKLKKESLVELSFIINSENQSQFIQEFNNGKISDHELNNILNTAKYMNDSRTSLLKMTDIITELGSGTSIMTEKINNYRESGYLDNDPRVKKAVKEYSKLLTNLAVRLDEEIDVFANHFSRAIRSYEKLAKVYFELTQDYKALQECHDSINPFPEAIDGTIAAFKFMRNEISGLPKKYSLLKKAKTKSISTINEILNEFKTAKVMSLDFTNQVSKLID